MDVFVSLFQFTALTFTGCSMPYVKDYDDEFWRRKRFGNIVKAKQPEPANSRLKHLRNGLQSAILSMTSTVNRSPGVRSTAVVRI
jgi:hypothetical protein